MEQAGRLFALLDGIKVDCYGTPTPLPAGCVIKYARKPPDSNPAVGSEDNPDIEKAIRNPDLGLTPTNDGKVIRIQYRVARKSAGNSLLKS